MKTNIFNRLKIFSKEIIRKYKLRKFYLENYNSKKTYIAVILDSIAINFVVLMTIIIIFYYFTVDLLFSLIISFQFFLLYLFMMVKIKNIKKRNNIEHTNSKIAKAEVLKNINNKTPDDFIDYIKHILNDTYIKNIEESTFKDIDIVGLYNNKKIGIKCFQYDESYKVGVSDLRNFFLSLRNIDLNEGIIITTSNFDSDIKEFLNKIQNHATIHLIDNNKLLSLVKMAGEYPNEKEIEKMILNIIEDSKNKLKELTRNSIVKGKFSAFFIAGVLLLFWSRLTSYKLYYLSISYVLFIFSFIILIYNIIKLIKPKSIKEKDIL